MNKQRIPEKKLIRVYMKEIKERQPGSESWKFISRREAERKSRLKA